MIKAEFRIGEEKIEETLPLLEGNMRLRCSSQLTERLIVALQEGKEVIILVDGFEERLNPAHFLRAYKKLQAKETFLKNLPLKGLL